MTFEHDLDSLKQRITRAETAREGWRLSGGQEKYLEACSTLGALEIQLEQLYVRHSRALARVPGPGAGD